MHSHVAEMADFCQLPDSPIQEQLMEELNIIPYTRVIMSGAQERMGTCARRSVAYSISSHTEARQA